MSSVQSPPGRNDPCPCGSGKKFKQCCLGKAASPQAEAKKHVLPIVLAVVAVVVGIGVGVSRDVSSGVVVAVSLLLVAGGAYAFMNVPPPDPKGGNPGAINFGN